MIRIIFIHILAIFCTISISAQPQKWNKTFDEFIKKGIKDWQIPGLATVVVVNGDVVFKNAYGIRDISTQEVVDENTLFSMASTTKAITAIALGILVDQGKISWDDKVTDYIPEFRLSNPLITNEARIRDLLTHNLGISSPPILWMYDLSIEELIKKCSLIDQVYPIRGGFVYQNTMYVIASEIISRVSGTDWRVFFKEHILDNLNMNRTITNDSELIHMGNYAAPHYNDYEEGIIKIDCYLSPSYGAAGGMWSSINDIGNYITFLLNGGAYQGDTIIKQQTLKELFTPQTTSNDIYNFYPTMELVEPDWVSYGFGWFQHNYRGSKIDYHTGSLEGYVAITGLIHDKNVAVYVFANLDHSELRHAIMYKAFDLYAFDDDSRDWNKEVFNFYSEKNKNRIKAIENRNKNRIKNTSPLPLHQYSGTYYHNIGGKVKIGVINDSLTINLNNIYKLIASHWHYNTFVTNKSNPVFDRDLINFTLNKEGNVESLRILNMDYLKK